ncbi:hypothetical protein RISK_004281 [Rhodopirellula islandica]|uniref:Uncharacterized protein n=1 Tax=Rhodopirellula islandica TaxID=595434 RepID=A0A0J1EEF1_RHOIS|nr:hypothetical protein RISK_004281 [Rhodopirellula islandica]
MVMSPTIEPRRRSRVGQYRVIRDPMIARTIASGFDHDYEHRRWRD